MIVRTCLRVATVEALRDRTWAATKVYDSNNSPVDVAAREEPAPFISVFTDTDERPTVTGRDIFNAAQHLRLVIEFGLGGAVPAGDQGPTVGIPATDSGFERALDLIERQILLALIHDPKSGWGEVWRNLVTGITSVRSDRGAEAERGQRWAARAITMTLDALSEPAAGEPLEDDSPINAFLSLTDTSSDAGLRGIAEAIRNELERTAAPDWRRGQALLGLTEPEARGIAIAPPYDVPDDEVHVAAIGLDTDKPPVDEEAADAEVNPEDLPEPIEPAVPPTEPPPNKV